ncbi:hypothetical protein [Gordonia sp. NPDC003422]
MSTIRTAEDAEANATRRMREMGFPDAYVAAPGTLEVHAARGLAHVKWHRGMVDKSEVQNLFGARAYDHSKQLLYFTDSAYAHDAIDYATSTQIALFVYRDDGTLVPVNMPAHSVQARVAATPSTTWTPAATTTYPKAPGLWKTTGWPFVRRHWRLIGAIVLTLAIPGGIMQLISPDPGTSRGETIGTLIGVIVGATIFWALYFADRNRKQHGTTAVNQPSSAAEVTDASIQALWKRSMERLNAVRVEYAAYETDPTQFFFRPLLSDLNHPAVQAFHDAFASADALRIDDHVPTDATLVRDFADRVTAAERTWRKADALAREAGTSPFTADQQDLLRTAQRAIDLALDVNASANERAAAYSRVLALFEKAKITPPDSIGTALRRQIDSVTRQSLPTSD